MMGQIGPLYSEDEVITNPDEDPVIEEQKSIKNEKANNDEQKI